MILIDGAPGSGKSTLTVIQYISVSNGAEENYLMSSLL